MRRDAIALCVLLSGSVVTAQRLTLTDLVKQAGADVHVTISDTSPAHVPFSQLLARTEYVVRATIGSGSSYLSEDGYTIFTTFELRDQHVVFASKLFQSAAPGATAPPLALTQAGGTVRIDGFRVTVSLSDDTPKLTEGMDVILFLREYKGKYIVTSSDGVFEVRDRKVIPTDRSPGEHQTFAGMSVDAFEAHVVTVGNGLPGKR